MPQIPASDMSSVSSLLTQLAYCSSSFARIGLDFHSALQPIIEDAVFEIVHRGFREAKEALELSASEARKAGKTPSEWLIVGGVPAIPSSAVSTAVHVPPAYVVSYPPLAIFTNGILSTLNALRLLPVAGLAPRLERALITELRAVSSLLLAVVRDSLSGSGTGSRRSLDESDKVKDTKVSLSVGRVLWGRSGVEGYLVEALRAGVYRKGSGTGDDAWWRDGREDWVRWSKGVDPLFEIDPPEEVEVVAGDHGE